MSVSVSIFGQSSDSLGHNSRRVDDGKMRKQSQQVDLSNSNQECFMFPLKVLSVLLYPLCEVFESVLI